ncbi:AAA family ATPase, partial [Nocardia sp. NPDC051990]|uniref:AAA family ATPase n=1 Tax=Nocardia sp. NPDC051990 TaxID=3155285 RepID=UPI00341BF568
DCVDGLLALVNGLPGAGKTTLGAQLARSLDAWFLSKDTLEEALASSIENAVDVRNWAASLWIQIWALAARSPAALVSWCARLRAGEDPAQKSLA